MAVVAVDFDGNIEDLQDQLDQSNLEAEVDMQGDPPAGARGQDEDGGLVPGGRSAIVGAIVAVAGLLSPIKEILEGIRNFFLVTLAPVFTALRPIFDLLTDILVGIGRFLSGDLSLGDIISSIADTLMRVGKQLANGIIQAVSAGIPGINIQQPFPSAGTPGSQQGGSRTGGRTRKKEIGSPLEEFGEWLNPFDGLVDPLWDVGNAFMADRTDEAQKDALSNRMTSQNSEQFGGDAGTTNGGT